MAEKPLPHMDIAWNALSCSVPSKGGETVHILSNVSGYARAGKITAIMGPSGAGKTTMVRSWSVCRWLGVARGWCRPVLHCYGASVRLATSKLTEPVLLRRTRGAPALRDGVPQPPFLPTIQGTNAQKHTQPPSPSLRTFQRTALVTLCALPHCLLNACPLYLPLRRVLDARMSMAIDDSLTFAF
jgi:hypothetical protein